MENAKDILLKTGRLALKVTPKARHEGIEGMNDAGELVIKVRAAPSDGEANKAVLALLADRFGLPKTSLAMVRGSTGRHKIVAYLGPRA